MIFLLICKNWQDYFVLYCILKQYNNEGNDFMFCLKCGSHNNQEDYFCSKCGNQLYNNQLATKSDHMSQNPSQYVSMTSDKNKSTAQRLCIISFVCAFITLGITKCETDVHPLLYLLVLFSGAHRFYVGKIGTSILYMFTFGLFFIGILIDLFKISMGQFTDNVGQPLRK